MDGTQHPIILFDGACNLCESSVQWVIRHDPESVFKLASQQSTVGQALLGDHFAAGQQPDSIVLIEDGKAYSRSEGALRIAARLPGVVRFIAVARVLPKPIRDAVYNLIARNRYRWFGQKDVCWIPTPSIRARFLDSE